MKHKKDKLETSLEKATLSEGEDKEPKINEIDMGAIRTVTGGGHVSIDTDEWIGLMEVSVKFLI